MCRVERLEVVFSWFLKFDMKAGAMACANRLTCLAVGTGYIGGRFFPLLEERGEMVRYLTRRPDFVRQRTGASSQTIKRMRDCLNTVN
jgi:hypothetical protein